MVYDVLNRLTERDQRAEGNSSTFAYDAAGRSTPSTDADGHVRVVNYDALSREAGETWLTFGIAVNVQTFTYDADGDKLTAADYSGAYTMAYDALDRMTSEQEPFGQALTYSYDAASNRTVVQDSQGGTTTSVYDALNRLTTREFGGPGQTTLREDLTYTARDQIATESRYTDLADASSRLRVLASYTYDAAMRPTQLTDLYANGTVLASYVYNYDQASRLTSEVDNGVTTSYSYNAANELTGSGFNRVRAATTTGNRNTTGYSNGPDNQLLNDGTWTYTYDQNGNLMQKSEGPSATTWFYGYDNDNRLVTAKEMSQASGGTLLALATYAYDVFGNRIEEDEYTSASGVTTVTRFAYDGKNAWSDLTSGKAMETRRLYLDGSDHLLARISAAGTGTWYDTDHLGSVRDAVNFAKGRWCWTRSRTTLMEVSRLRPTPPTAIAMATPGGTGMPSSSCNTIGRGTMTRCRDGGRAKIRLDLQLAM